MAYLPGVESDGLTPGGLVVSGGVFLGKPSNRQPSDGYVDIRPVDGALEIYRTTDNVVVFNIALAPDSSGLELLMHDHLNNQLWAVNADGSELLTAGLGRFGHAAPVAASVITGALSAVTDPAAKAVLTSIISALTADGGATDGTT